MKKLFAILILLVGYKCNSQSSLSPYWNIKQNINFPWPGAIVKYLSVPSPNVIWTVAYDNFNANRTYNYFSTSKNGGTTYTLGTVFSDTLDYGLSSIFALDSLTAWVSAYRKPASSKPSDVIFHTTNGGVTWSDGGNSSMFSGSTSFANFIAFVSPSVGITVGDPVSNDFEIYRTTNAGTSWTVVPGVSLPNALVNEYGIANVFATFGNSIWFGTDNGRIYRSSDAGQTWAVSTVTTAAVYGVINISFVDANNGLALIYTGGNYSLHKSTDGGATWNVIAPLSVFLGLDDIANVPGTTMFVSCGGNVSFNYLISYSTDLGLTWQSNWGGSLIRYFEMAFTDNITGYAGGQSNVSNASLDGMFKYSGGPLGIENKDIAPYAFNLYPNPSNGIITLKLPSAKNGLHISIINALGQEVYSEEIMLQSSVGNYSFDLSKMEKGLYFFSIEKNGETFNQKIVIE